MATITTLGVADLMVVAETGVPTIALHGEQPVRSHHGSALDCVGSDAECHRGDHPAVCTVEDSRQLEESD